ncbi:MAG: hypothetical protein IPK19_39980 [Chloroflexi bacterium]|nr:hypothetical protein [Chloroflexota bacterium]
MQHAAARTVFDVITDFISSDPDPQAILNFRLPPELEERAAQLLEQNREDALTFDEQLEMYDFIRADDMMTLLKAKTRLKLSGKT